MKVLVKVQGLRKKTETDNEREDAECFLMILYFGGNS